MRVVNWDPYSLRTTEFWLNLQAHYEDQQDVQPTDGGAAMSPERVDNTVRQFGRATAEANDELERFRSVIGAHAYDGDLEPLIEEIRTMKNDLKALSTKIREASDRIQSHPHG